MATSAQDDPALDLQLAYMISGEAKTRSTNQLFWAIDRLWHDRASVDEHARENRADATQIMSKELDARGAPLRHPRATPFYPGPCPL